MLSSQILIPLSPFVPFGLREYILLHTVCFDVKRFQSMWMGGERNLVYDTLHGADRLWAAGGWVKPWMFLGSCGAVLLQDLVAYVDMNFTRFTEEEAYASRLELIVRNGSGLTDAATAPCNMSHSHALSNHNISWHISSTGGRRFSLHRNFVLGAMQHYLLTGVVSIFLVFPLVVGSCSSITCRKGDVIVRGVACWWCLHQSFWTNILHWRLMRNVVVFFSVSPFQSIMFSLSHHFHIWSSQQPGWACPCVWGCHGSC